MGFFARFRNSLRPTAGSVYVPRRIFHTDAPAVRLDVHSGSVSAAVALTARGSVALSRLPVVDEVERNARLQRMANYDFTPHS